MQYVRGVIFLFIGKGKNRIIDSGPIVPKIKRSGYLKGAWTSGNKKPYLVNTE
jgi:hypothetical protein